MNKKKILVVAMSLAMVAILAIGGTIAYFTDSDSDRNVMTAGNVTIVQNETQRDGTAYEDGQALLPAVYLDADGNPYNPTTTWEGPAGGASEVFKGPDGKDMAMYTENIGNEIDKVISVTNGGNLPAYIRTIILMENTADNAICDKIHGAYANNDGQYRKWVTHIENGKEIETQVVIDGTTYSIAVCTYNTALEAGATSAPSLKQVWLDPSADNEWYDLLGDGKFTIIAFSQAVQTAGFSSATEALNTAFGEVTGENVLTWLAETPVKTTDFANVVPTL